jgi:hypothetical protein
MLNRPRLLVSAAILPLLLMACNPGGLSDPSGASVTVLFRGASAGGSPAAGLSAADTSPLTIPGSNGTLEITSIKAIVDELELDCESRTTGPCVDFEAGPSFETVPLGADEVVIADAVVPPGRYDEFEFDIDDLDGDDDDSAAERAAKRALLAEIRSTYPDFPSDASMIVEGSFTPAGGAAVAFRTYLEADIEVELPLDPPLEVVEGAGPVTVPVTIDPRLWLTLPDGRVLDLSAFDYARTGQVPEIDVEVEGAFAVEIEFDDD